MIMIMMMIMSCWTRSPLTGPLRTWAPCLGAPSLSSPRRSSASGTGRDNDNDNDGDNDNDKWCRSTEAIPGNPYGVQLKNKKWPLQKVKTHTHLRFLDI